MGFPFPVPSPITIEAQIALRNFDLDQAVVAAKISERDLIAAAERLGVRCQQGQWWPPG